MYSNEGSSEGVSSPGLKKDVGKRRSRNQKCIRVKLERVKMVVGLDVVISEVEGLMEKALVGRLMGKFVKGKSLKLVDGRELEAGSWISACL